MTNVASICRLRVLKALVLTLAAQPGDFECYEAQARSQYCKYERAESNE
jgi:hypothetical protein